MWVRILSENDFLVLDAVMGELNGIWCHRDEETIFNHLLLLLFKALDQCQRAYLLFFSRNFIVSRLRFKSLSHFKLIFVYSVKIVGLVLVFFEETVLSPLYILGCFALN